jgi:hypothetical protein
MQELKDYRNQGDKIEGSELHIESVGYNLTGKIVLTNIFGHTF